MLFTILIMVLMVLSFLIWYHYESKPHSFGEIDLIGGLSGFLCILSGCVLFASILIILFVQAPRDIDYQQMLVEKEIIEVKLERVKEASNNPEYILNGDIGSLQEVYKEALEFNKLITRHAYWSESIWFNWFYNSRYKDVGLIDVS